MDNLDSVPVEQPGSLRLLGWQLICRLCGHLCVVTANYHTVCSNCCVCRGEMPNYWCQVCNKRQQAPKHTSAQDNQS